MNSYQSPFHPSQPLTTKVGAFWGDYFGRDVSQNRLNQRRGRQILTGLSLVSSVLLLASCNDEPVKEPAAAYCEFSSETTSIDVQQGDGLNDVLLQIDGVNYDQCLTSARQIVALLNPGVNIDAPRFDESIEIPVSARFVPGES